MIAVIGGGISGLASGFYLKKNNIPFTLYDTSPTLGGMIQSKDQSGTVYEYGPNSLRDKTGILFNIINELGLQNKLISISEASKTRYLVKNGNLHGLKSNPLSILNSNILSMKGKIELFSEFLKSPKKINNESVGDFFTRRFGKEVADQIVDPVFKGIYAGDIYNLNKEMVLGELADYERKYGSLLKGFIKTSKKRNTSLVFSFKGGLQTLTNAISEAIQSNINYKSVQDIKYTGERVTIFTHSGAKNFQKVISTTPSYVLADLLRTLDPKFSSILNSIAYSPIASLILSYERSSIKIPEDGFGFLIPSNEKKKLLGAIWRSSIFPDLVHPQKYVFNLLIGGAMNMDILKQSKDDITKQAISEFNQILDISSEPSDVDYKLWPKAIPQFTKNYQDILKTIIQFEAKFPNIHIGGNFRWGVSVPDCVKGALDLVSNLKNA